MAAAEHMNILPNYIKWIRKTKETLNLSQLVADHIPSNAGQKPTLRYKGRASFKGGRGGTRTPWQTLAPLNFK